MPIATSNSDLKVMKSRSFRAALLCPPSVQSSPQYTQMKRDFSNLHVVNNLVDALLLIRDEKLTHFMVMKSKIETLSQSWPDELTKIRSQFKLQFAIIVVKDI